MNNPFRNFAAIQGWQSLVRILIFAVVGALAKTGIDAAEQQQHSEAIAAAVVALVGLLTAVPWSFASKQTIANEPSPDEIRDQTGKTPPAPLWALAFLLLTAVGGCAKSPEARYYQARSAVTLAEETLSDLYEAGEIPPREMVASGEVIKAARRSLEVAKTQLPDGSPTFNQYLNAANGAVLPLLKLYATPKKGTATNGPDHSRLDYHGGSERRGVFGDSDRAVEGGRQGHARAGGDDRGGGERGGCAIRCEPGRRGGEACGGRELSYYLPRYTLNRLESYLCRSAA